MQSSGLLKQACLLVLVTWYPKTFTNIKCDVCIHGYYGWFAFDEQIISGLNFPKFPVTNKTAFTGISEKQDNLARYTQFLELSYREFALHFILIFLPEFPIEWFVFQKSNNFRII